MSEIMQVHIDALGAEGHGLARLPDGAALFVAGALPGEEVTVLPTGDGRARLEKILHPSADRVDPPCDLFGRCGGCSVQYMSLPLSLRWKTDTVLRALHGAGYTDPIPVTSWQGAPLTRRRVDLAFARTEQGMVIGLHRKRGEVVDMTQCHVLEPALFALLPLLRPMLHSLPAIRRGGDLQINMLDSGPDLLLATDGPLGPDDRRILAQFAASQRIPRISWRPQGSHDIPETAAQTGGVWHEFSGVRTAPPPGAFLQPSRAGEDAIRCAILEALPTKRLKGDIIELYAGCGTLSFALAERGRVMAHEGDAAAFACLKQACGGTRVQPFHRDLNRQPVMGAVLAKAGAVVLDPPHAGAGAQLHQITDGKPLNVIYVSCNPTALRRDATALRQAGYRLDRLTVIDQFLWSTEVESVCLFTRPAPPRRR
ncbi:RNA methyltransferase [Novacetimonas hansenii]|uniref:RNA methyltransferase n=3 Tax=Novacetimonas hansenii TaxID=436 RepID=A0ABQ0SBD7_NOVHA|nr:TRAM domain-containing protein [Novacetimonas hansenii]EFG83524.1 23S rRNA (uracil-5-)-methyltransferase RumA [Novacetimonas hansenii ATCC 23769]GAN83932.1 ribosomal RNA 23S/tRNA (uracil-5-)methyltransferase [Novacetimonas hansenii JCM 7643]GEC62517.1 RNA methyltransferase [Novacetimonas hansenii]